MRCPYLQSPFEFNGTMTNINVAKNVSSYSVRVWKKENKIEIEENISKKPEVPKNKMTISLWLKIMQRVLLLPAKFIKRIDSKTESEETQLIVTRTGKFLVFFADLLSMLLCLVLIFVFRYLNRKEDSLKLTDVFSKDFLLGMFNGVATDAIAQGALWSFSAFIWLPIRATG